MNRTESGLPESETLRVDIALSVFNGERFLDAFLESLASQTHGPWRLVVRNDGSTDGTQARLEEWARRWEDRMLVIEDADGNLGVVESFGRALAECDAPYVMWADADDIWLPTKIERTLTTLVEAEARRSDPTPCLAYTDLIVADREARPMAPSFWAYEGIIPEQVSALHLLSRGMVTGCTVMMNQPLKALVLPIPHEAISHDWWASILAALSGEMVALDEATILYRQHGSNDLGAKHRSFVGYVRRARSLGKMIDKCIELGHRTRAQAAAVHQRIASRSQEMGLSFDARTLDLVRQYSELGDKGFFRRKSFLAQNGLIKDDPVTSVAKYVLW